MNIAMSLNKIVRQSGYQILGQEQLPSRGAKFLQIPSRLHDKVRNQIAQSYPDGLYSHQTEAINAALKGDDICLATSTASGKSLVYIALAADMILGDIHSRVVAFYPARALIQDQLEKWEAVLNPLNLSFGFIDGSLPVSKRNAVLDQSQVVLMTPDVAHAWLMRNLKAREIRYFLRNIKLLILDEAHTYEGVFGTNMAYFLRRLQAVSKPQRIITSTATLDSPSKFVYQLTGRQPRSFGPEADGSATPPKTILLVKEAVGQSFECMVSLLENLAESYHGKFLAFGDSRKMVEQIVMALKRSANQSAEGEKDIDQAGIHQESGTKAKPESIAKTANVLPYRAGYESVDRNAIQKALAKGYLNGVVSTSALELGIDIGEVDLIVLLNQPPSQKAFWQRVGRAGRKRPGVCLLIDYRGHIADSPLGLQKYVQTPLEQCWLYLQNRFIQYTNALCAVQEYRDFGEDQYDATPFDSVPAKFNHLLENELNPSAPIPQDLQPLKQRAAAGPHREFPIRTGMEKNFRVKQRSGKSLGKLTFSQVLREGYPGAVYYYMGRPYRVKRYHYNRGEILVDNEKYWTTRPQTTTMVFPSFEAGMLKLFRSDDGFLAESEVMISERVTGFVEQRGPSKIEHDYGPSSPFYKREINRYFGTTGVCWWSGDGHPNSVTTARRILEVFCLKFGVQQRDLGIGVFHSRVSPTGILKCRGMCIFDATQGSLRLTERLADSFGEILEEAIFFARLQKDAPAVQELEAIAGCVANLRPQRLEGARVIEPADENDCSTVIAAGENAIYESTQGPMQVVVLEHRSTPHGLMYEVKPFMAKQNDDIASSPTRRAPFVDRNSQKSTLKWLVAAKTIQPIPGETKMVRVNVLTDKSEPLENQIK
jgi:DEAD/DEAH box helicase domain-containing protein